MCKGGRFFVFPSPRGRTCRGGVAAHATVWHPLHHQPPPSLPSVNCGKIDLLLRQHDCDSAGAAAGREDDGDNAGPFSPQASSASVHPPWAARPSVSLGFFARDAFADVTGGRTPVRHLFLVKCLCICKQADRELRLGNLRSPLTIILLNARRGPLPSAFNCAVRGVRACAKPTGSKVKHLYSPPTWLPMGGEVKISNWISRRRRRRRWFLRASATPCLKRARCRGGRD